MTTIDPLMLLAAGRMRDLQDDARRHALARIATCCRPSALRAALHTVLRAARRRLTAPRGAGDRVCCA